MVLVHPYITDKFVSYEGDTFITHLSLAVRLKDDYTQEEPIGYIEVNDREENQKAVKNLSGYYIFTDLAVGDHTVSVKSNIYNSIEMTVNIPLLDPKDPVLEILLKPLPSYPFPAKATLVRGVIFNLDKNLIVNVIITAVEPNIETMSDERGEFVLYFKDVTNKKITLQIRKNGTTNTIEIDLEEGETKSLGKISFP